MLKLMKNSNYTQINSASEACTLIGDINWEDAFIKESHFYSPSFMMKDGIIAADSKLLMKISICLPENNNKIIEFKFKEIEEICLLAMIDIWPRIIIRHNEVEFKFSQESNYSIRCKSIYFRFLEDYLSSDCPIYTDEDIYFKG